MAAAVLPRLPRHVTLCLSLGLVAADERIDVDGAMAAELAGCSNLSSLQGNDLDYTPAFLNGLLTAPLAGLTKQLKLNGDLDGPTGAAPIIMGVCLAQRAAQGLRPLRIDTDLLTEEEGRQVTTQLRAVGGPGRVTEVYGRKRS